MQRRISLQASSQVELRDEAVALEYRDEQPRAYEADFRVEPANQGLGAADLVGTRIVLRLVEHGELQFAER